MRQLCNPASESRPAAKRYGPRNVDSPPISSTRRRASERETINLATPTEKESRPYRNLDASLLPAGTVSRAVYLLPRSRLLPRASSRIALALPPKSFRNRFRGYRAARRRDCRARIDEIPTPRGILPPVDRSPVRGAKQAGRARLRLPRARGATRLAAVTVLSIHIGVT